MLKRLLRFFLLVFVFFIFSARPMVAQNFQRIEVTAGLGILEENNGVAVADYDGDNDLDIFVVAKAVDNENSPKTISRLFRNNNNGTFTDVTEIAGLTNQLSPEEAGDDYFGLDGQKSGA